MKSTVEWIYWMLFVLTMTSSLNSCTLADRQKDIIKELQQINSQLEERNEQ